MFDVVQEQTGNGDVAKVFGGTCAENVLVLASVSPAERIYFQLNGPSDERREANAVMFQRFILECTNTTHVLNSG